MPTLLFHNILVVMELLIKLLMVNKSL